MLKVAVFTDDSESYLESKVNRLIEDNDTLEIVDVKFSTSSALKEDEIVTIYSALVIYQYLDN